MLRLFLSLLFLCVCLRVLCVGRGYGVCRVFVSRCVWSNRNESECLDMCTCNRTISEGLELISMFELEFRRRGNHFFERFEFLVCSEFNHIQLDCTCACSVACLHPHYSISNVVVSLTIHDNICEKCVCTCTCVYICVSMCV